MAPTKSRQDLKAKFVRNAIPTEQDFKDLIDASLNQSDDGIFRNSGEPLSIVAGSDAQKRAVRFYGSPPSGATAPDWLISLNPGQDPNDAATNRAGFGIADGAGATRLYLDAAGNLGLGTNDPQAKLHVAGGGARIEGDLTVAGTTAFTGAITASGQVTLGKDDGSLNVVIRGAVEAARSDLYFTKTDHVHTGIGNTQGFAAIENSAGPYNALMLLGRQTTSGRVVKVWDYLEVNGNFRSTGNGDIGGSLTIGTTTPPFFRVGAPSQTGAGTIRLGDWLLRTSGNFLDLVYSPPKPLVLGGGAPPPDRLVARFDATGPAAGPFGRLTLP
jgi:hypothetical protein